MEQGVLSLPRKLGISTTDQVFFTSSAVLDNRHGVLNVGDGAFDGISSGKFTAGSFGTIVAINSSSTFGGNFIDIQLAGNRKFLFDTAGQLFLPTAPSSNAGLAIIRAGSSLFASGGGGTNFTGSTNGTVIGINVLSSYTGNLIDMQTAGVSQFKVDPLGNATALGALNDGTGIGAGSRLENYYSFT